MLFAWVGTFTVVCLNTVMNVEKVLRRASSGGGCSCEKSRVATIVNGESSVLNGCFHLVLIMRSTEHPIAALHYQGSYKHCGGALRVLRGRNLPETGLDNPPERLGQIQIGTPRL